MSSEQNKAIVRRFAEEFKNRANHAIVDELFAEDFVHHFVDPRLPPGRAALKALGGMIVKAFPDVHATIEQMIAEADLVVERTSATATHTGDFNGIPPTNRKLRWTELHMYRLSGGKIAELWSEIDMLALLTQIGALPGAK